jgi:hypothetical protein
MLASHCTALDVGRLLKALCVSQPTQNQDHSVRVSDLACRLRGRTAVSRGGPGDDPAALARSTADDAWRTGAGSAVTAATSQATSVAPVAVDDAKRAASSRAEVSAAMADTI